MCIVWGTTYLGIKIALETVPPFLMGGLRYVLAGLILAAFVRLRGDALPARRTWPQLIVMGALMLGLGNGGVVWGTQFLTSGLTAVLIATNPFWMVSVDALVRPGQQFRRREWLGLIVGFIGIVLLVWPEVMAGGSLGRSFLWGVIAVQIACAGWALGSSYARRDVGPADIIGAAALQMLFGGLLLLLAGTLLGEWPRLSFNFKTSMAFAYLTVVGSVVAFAAYSFALRHLDIAVVSLYTYINPVIAVALGAVVLGEPVTSRMIIASAIIVMGVVVVGPAKKH